MPEKEVLIPIAAMAIPIVVVPTALLFKHLARRREYAHRERMRAIEMGQGSGGGLFWPSMAAVIIGAGVPFCALLCAFVTALIRPDIDEVWPAAGFIGVAGVVGGSWLGGRLIHAAVGRSAPAPTPDVADSYTKPSYDPDAFDTVGRRG
jgi:hypothetical protein